MATRRRLAMSVLSAPEVDGECTHQGTMIKVEARSSTHFAAFIDARGKLDVEPAGAFIIVTILELGFSAAQPHVPRRYAERLGDNDAVERTRQNQFRFQDGVNSSIPRAQR